MNAAPIPPSAPSTIPSIKNGQRMNQSVAPTSFMTSTSRRRANIDRRIVLAISSTDASASSPIRTAIASLSDIVPLTILSVSRLGR